MGVAETYNTVPDPQGQALVYRFQASWLRTRAIAARTWFGAVPPT
jgi:hypothetical protein